MSTGWTGDKGGIPRTRGDGPRFSAPSSAPQKDSPHPRGWTLLSWSTGFGFGRIPRTRGDGPTFGSTFGTAFGDSPHPRGWTASASVQSRDDRGFPAPAGMDRRRRRAGVPNRRIPRTRGDGPRCGLCTSTPSSDSPHPRGWTRRADWLCVPRVGFPAPAGMDPRRRGCCEPRARIPRTRGDGPCRDGVCRPVGRDSPHPRGWTRTTRGADGPTTGFPAPAGMDPRLHVGGAAPRRIPRTRGDGPRTPAPTARPPADSPHPRGWTPSNPFRRTAERGFPAPAGMDPCRRAERCIKRRIPRTRGDGPCMILLGGGVARDSPHPRGWTREKNRPRVDAVGFPAPAGMDPDDRAIPAPDSWIPRTRGDGPRPPTPVVGDEVDSPHPRGWTQGGQGERRGDRGFPAPAGMDPGLSAARPAP